MPPSCTPFFVANNPHLFQVPPVPTSGRCAPPSRASLAGRRIQLLSQARKGGSEDVALLMQVWPVGIGSVWRTAAWRQDCLMEKP